ncbi:hypothetical protein [Kocuria sp. CPCC 204721]|uniref:hypothetical protein n=1 Tax=Kocuria sp. CPCC 204721 TaxID=3073548 RepID=UPI0034D531D7
MPQKNTASRHVASYDLGIAKDLMRTMQLMQKTLISQTMGGSAAVSALQRSLTSPVLKAFEEQQRRVTMPTINALAAQYRAITVPAATSLTRSILASSGATSIPKAFTAPVLPHFELPSIQRMITQTTAPTASQFLATAPALNQIISDMVRQLEEAAEREETLADLNTAEPVELFPDEQTMEQAWHDIERMFRSDKQMRRSIKADARRLATQAKMGHKKLVKLLMVVVWLCAVIGPWTDGEKKVDDFATPIGLLAAEIITYLEVYPESRPNLLQKNGPRRRRHRRKNHRRGHR